jgi:hypothetical protein
MKTYTTNELGIVLKNHKLWLLGDPTGMCANLSGTTLSGADLSGADLSGADLSGTNLFGANLTNTILDGKKVITFTFGQHLASYTGLDEIVIGCHRHSLQHWLANFEEIGRANNYTNEQIEAYGKFIKSCVRDFNKGVKRDERKVQNRSKKG